MNTPSSRPRRGILGAIGPAIITASVVLGPGSILSNSNVGSEFGYSMLWVLVFACVMMVAMVALSARLGVLLERTLCEELAHRAGRPLAILAGGSLFLVATCFQFGNNLGVIAAIEDFIPQQHILGTPLTVSDVVLVLLNAAIIAALYGFQHLYVPVEKLMMILVGIMLIGFAGNLILAKPSLTAVAGGLVPKIPNLSADALLPLVAVIATTFSVGGAFYQSYLVRQKGWDQEDLKQGFIDSAVGISVLGLISAMIMLTAASVLHGSGETVKFKSAADVARQLQPLFGTKAQILFCAGLFAGAFSSFLVNAVIAGSMLADGFGLGGKMDDAWPKAFTVFALLTGMIVAISIRWTGESPVQLIIFAQSVTVLGNPLLAGTMIWLATRPDIKAKHLIPNWLLGLTILGFVLVVILAAQQGVKVFNAITG